MGTKSQNKLTSISGFNFSVAQKTIKKAFPLHFDKARKNFINKTYDFYLFDRAMYGKDEVLLDTEMVECYKEDPDYTGFKFIIVSTTNF